jgi:hypothetical protein
LDGLGSSRESTGILQALFHFCRSFHTDFLNGNTSKKKMTTDAKQCPWCSRWALKDDACNWVTCGLIATGFVPMGGCGHQFCFLCAKKLCGRLFDENTGTAFPGVPTQHTHTCCLANIVDASVDDICPGGHNSHK